MSVNIPPINRPGSPLPGKNNIPGSPVVNEPQPLRPNTPGTNFPNNPSSRPNTPGPVAIVNTSRRSATKYLEDERKEDASLQLLKHDAQEIYKRRGPLCDSEGFYQHTGECWNDALQQIFCNADGIKEIIQSTYVHWNFDTDHHTQMPDWMFVPTYFRTPEGISDFAANNRIYIDELKKWFNLYLRESQKRFLRHYLLETKRRNVKQEICKIEGAELGDIAREKLMAISRDPAFRKGGVQAQQSAIYGKVTNLQMAQYSSNFSANKMVKPTRETYIKEGLAGGSDTDEDYIIDLYNNLFFRGQLKVTDMTLSLLRYQVLDIPAFKTFLDSVTGIYFAISKSITHKNGKRKGSGHGLAFYECGKQELFYEDNYGIFPFPWRKYILKFVELTKENLEPRMEFTQFHVVNKELKLFFHTSFYPVLSYTDKEGTYHTLLILDEDIVETNNGTQTKFTFKTELEGNTVKLDYNAEDVYRFRRFVFLQPVPGTVVGNVGFEINAYSRIGVHPIFRAILEKDVEAALEAIEIEKVIPDLKMRKEGKEDLPVLHAAFFLLPGDEVVLKLIEKGYNIKAKYDGDTVLDEALYRGRVTLVKALIQKDSSLLEEKNEFGRTPLSMAVDEDARIELTKFLMDKGANIETQSTLGRTPLYYAAREGAFETVKLLCAKGANPTVVDKGNPEQNQPPMTPIEVAKTPELKEFLMNQCGKTGGRRRTRKANAKKRKQSKKKTRRS